jgi:hypothetical protein
MIAPRIASLFAKVESAPISLPGRHFPEHRTIKFLS